MFERLSVREKNLGILTAGLIGLALLYTALVHPLLARLVPLRDKIRQEGLRLAKYTKILNYRHKIERTYSETLGIVKVGGIEQEEISNFLKEVDRLCQASAVRLADMKPLGLKETDSVKKIQLEIEVDAQQASLGRLLFEFKNSPSMIHVDSLTISLPARTESLKCHFVLSKVIA